jgi:hypothetical protein
MHEHHPPSAEATSRFDPRTHQQPAHPDLDRAPVGRYGTAEVAASGIDRSQLRRNLQLTPTERVERMVAFVRLVLPLRGALRRRR